jgi:cellulose synthase/poly-beta-1,6-N-acetylglucosamine synthase-like glycosyltransferase
MAISVVDDASTDHTPEVMREKMAQYPGSVFHLRREKGGQGKAHTLNHGIRAILDENWAEAVMIMDADVLFERLTLRRMVRHLADPEVGGVTAYVKEGSTPANLPVSRFIAFEYITAQAAVRRAQNVMGALVCMAGGAQLHSCENLRAIGGAIDTSTLAEDTYTTFKTQLAGRRVLIDANAIVWAEEPDSLVALWKQRLRWGRGNLQITAAFRHLWFTSGRLAALGGVPFGVLWFSAALMPLFMILGAVGLVGLYFLWPRGRRPSPLLDCDFLHILSGSCSAPISPSPAAMLVRGRIFAGLVSLAMMAVAVSGVKIIDATDRLSPEPVVGPRGRVILA